MQTSNKWILCVFISLAALISSTRGLSCFKCVDFDEDIFGSSAGLYADPRCSDVHDTVEVDSEVCDITESCAYVTGTVQYNGNTTRIAARGCLNVDDTEVLSNDCTDTSSVDQLLQVLNISSGSPLAYNIRSLDGDMCYCNLDLCVAQECDGGVVIGTFCAHIWMFVLTGILSTLLITGFCCCCCCCCCGCCCGRPWRRNSRCQRQGGCQQPANDQIPVVTPNVYTNINHVDAQLPPYSGAATAAANEKQGHTNEAGPLESKQPPPPSYTASYP